MKNIIKSDVNNSQQTNKNTTSNEYQDKFGNFNAVLMPSGLFYNQGYETSKKCGVMRCLVGIKRNHVRLNIRQYPTFF